MDHLLAGMIPNLISVSTETGELQDEVEIQILSSSCSTDSSHVVDLRVINNTRHGLYVEALEFKRPRILSYEVTEKRVGTSRSELPVLVAPEESRVFALRLQTSHDGSETMPSWVEATLVVSKLNRKKDDNVSFLFRLRTK